MKAVLFGMANTAFTIAPFQVESAEASAEDVQLLPPRDGAHGNLSILQRTPFLTLEIRKVYHKSREVHDCHLYSARKRVRVVDTTRSLGGRGHGSMMDD